jgi:hypothetical protein
MSADHAESFGVFKPVGHVVLSFASADDAEAAARALADKGFAPADVRRYTPEQMVAQADIDIAKASPLSAIGQELNLVKAHRELALQGHSFLVVKAPKAEQTEQVADIALAHHATRAQKYGQFLIEELVDVGDNLSQVGESPDRGLDAQNLSGREADNDPHRPVR